MIKIEKGIPFKKKKKSTNLPFAEMEVGDSFLKPEGVSVSSLRARSSQFAKGTKKKFTTLETEDGFRCWRLK